MSRKPQSPVPSDRQSMSSHRLSNAIFVANVGGSGPTYPHRHPRWGGSASAIEDGVDERFTSLFIRSIVATELMKRIFSASTLVVADNGAILLIRHLWHKLWLPPG